MVGLESWGGEPGVFSQKGPGLEGCFRGLRRGEPHVGEAVPYDRIEDAHMEILGPYPNTSPRKASVFASCAYIRVQKVTVSDVSIVVHQWSGDWGNFRSRDPG